MVHLIALYPQPTDVKQFETDYAKHLVLLHKKTGIPTNARPYTVTKFLPTPEGPPPFFQMFMLPFESPEALQDAMSSAGMQEVAADANRISSGGAPTIMVGNQE